MDEKTIALVLGITGIISTLISSAMGLYFTAKARSSPLRELLFNKQLELMTQLVHTQELFRTFIMILSDKNQSNKEWAREELASQARIFFKAEHEAQQYYQQNYG